MTIERFIFGLDAPPFCRSENRGEALCRIIETLFPRLEIGWEIVEKGRLCKLDDREAFLAEKATSCHNLPLLCNGDEREPVTLSSHLFKPPSVPGEKTVLHVLLEFPSDWVDAALAKSMLAQVGDCTGAWHGFAELGHTFRTLSLFTARPQRQMGLDHRFVQNPKS